MKGQGIEGNLHLVAAINPVNLATGANDGDWVSLKNFAGVSVIIFKAAGGAAEPPTLTMEQATDITGANAKALAKITRVMLNQRLDLTAAGGDQYTETLQAAAGTFPFGSGSLGDNQAIMYADFPAELLDRQNGFDCVRARIAKVGATAQIGAVLYALWGARYWPAPSAIAN